MWSPTHVQVTVYRAKNLITKGKSGTNDAYVTIKLGDEKYQTSIKERSVDPDWMEECDLPLTDVQDVIHLNVYHRNLLGIDEFLGHVDIELSQFNIYERPRSRWYALRNKSSSKKPEKYRGEIEVKVTFIVQSMTGSQASLAKKGSFKRSSSIKTFAQSVGEKLTKKWPSKGSLTMSGSRPDLSSANSDTGDYSPTVRKIDKKGLIRSHTILPTSFNNQHLQETDQSTDQLDDGKPKEVKSQDFDRWQNALEHPIQDIEDEEKEDNLRKMRHKPMLAKSMFDLSTPSIEELAFDSNEPDTWTCKDDKEHSLCYISTSESDTLSPTTTPKKQCEQKDPTSESQTEDKTGEYKSKQVEAHENTESVESEKSMTEVKDTEVKDKGPQDEDRQKVEKYKKMKDVNRRHTLNYGRNNLPRATAHDLHEGIAEYQQRALENKDKELPLEVMEQFSDKSREDLIRMVLELNTQLHKKEQYNRDLENYIDNLLVKVMEVTPKLLQHPNNHSPSHSAQNLNSKGFTNGLSSYGTGPRSASRSSSMSSHKKESINKNVDNVNNSNNGGSRPEFIQQHNKTNKKQFNPFKKLQQVLK